MRVSMIGARTVALFALGLFAGGCASFSGGYSRGPVIDPASVVRVNRELQIPSGAARIFLLDGTPLAGRPATFETYCSVLMQDLHKPGDPLLKVLPGWFEVEQVREYNDFRYFPRIYVTSTHSMFEEWPANVVYSVELRLRSAAQPGVRALICSRHSGAEMYTNPRKYYPTREQIEQAVGDIVDIELP